MKRILLSGAVASWYEFSARKLREHLRGIEPGESVEIDISSPGGEVFEMIEIFNTLRGFCAEHRGKVTFRVLSLAASAASYIFLAGKLSGGDVETEVFSNSLFFIHNPWTAAAGDWREMKRQAEWLGKLTVLYGEAHARASGRGLAEIRKAMDAETWYVGEEIVKAGFADRVLDPPAGEAQAAVTGGRDVLVAQAGLQVAQAERQLEREMADRREEYRARVQAHLSGAGEPALMEAESGGAHAPDAKNNLEVVMTVEELKEKHPEVYATVYGSGRLAGIDFERGRVRAHLKLGETIGDYGVCAGYIRDGKSVLDEEVAAEYQAAALRAGMLAKREADNPGETGAANAGQHADAGKGEALAALDAELEALIPGYKKEAA